MEVKEISQAVIGRLPRYFRYLGELKDEVIFKGKEALVYGDFLRAYENALGKMYQYQIIIDKMQKESEKHAMTVEAAAKMFSEEQYRDKLYDALESLRKTYDIVTQDRMERQLKKQLELV